MQKGYDNKAIKVRPIHVVNEIGRQQLKMKIKESEKIHVTKKYSDEYDAIK